MWIVQRILASSVMTCEPKKERKQGDCNPNYEIRAENRFHLRQCSGNALQFLFFLLNHCWRCCAHVVSEHIAASTKIVFVAYIWKKPKTIHICADWFSRLCGMLDSAVQYYCNASMLNYRINGIGWLDYTDMTRDQRSTHRNRCSAEGDLPVSFIVVRPFWRQTAHSCH